MQPLSLKIWTVKEFVWNWAGKEENLCQKQGFGKKQAAGKNSPGLALQQFSSLSEEPVKASFAGICRAGFVQSVTSSACWKLLEDWLLRGALPVPSCRASVQSFQLRHLQKLLCVLPYCTAEILHQVLLLGLQILVRKYLPIWFLGALHLHCCKRNSLLFGQNLSKQQQN